MAVSVKIIPLAAAALLLCGAAQAQQASRCEGTLCDLYYGSGGNAPAATPATTATTTTTGVPAGATPMTVPSGGLMNWFSKGSSGTASTPSTRPPPPPSEEASSTNSYMHMGTGGVLGDHQDRCTGTLCDTFYGSSPSDTKTAPQQTAAAGPMPAAEPQIAHRHIVHESETRPKCSSPTADPWHCFR